MFDKLVMPTDGSDVSIAAADRAVALAKLTGAALHVVFVLEPYPYVGIGAASAAGMDEYLAAARAMADQAFQRIAKIAGAVGIRIETRIVEDAQPARAIVESAQSLGADLIVMGSHGRSGLAKLVLGSVATKVLQLSTVPVLIVK